MTHVVRTIALDDVEGGRVYGVAFEFMPESEEAAAAVERFVQHILVADEPANEPTPLPRLQAHAVGDARSARTKSSGRRWRTSSLWSDVRTPSRGLAMV